MNRKNYYFASANSGDGFIGDLKHLAPQDWFMYIIKGGSGMGKSTMMKKIASHFEKMGEDIEVYYCSTDPKSVDGIRLLDRKIAVVDGTMPHVVEPNILGVTHKIVDVGQALSNDVIQEKLNLENLVKSKKVYYQSAYNYLASAKILDENISNNFEINNILIKQAKNLFSKIKPFLKPGTKQEVFLGCLNDKEFSIETKNKFKVVSFLSDRYESSLVLKLLDEMLGKYQRKIVLDCLNPSIIKGIIIDNKILIKSIDYKIKTNKKIEKNNKIIKKIKNFAKNDIKKAKELHCEIEKIYLNYVDFNVLSKLTEKVINEIE